MISKNLDAIQSKVVYIFTTPFVPNEPTFPLYYDFTNKLKGSFIRKTQNKHSLIKFYDRKVFRLDKFLSCTNNQYFGNLQHYEWKKYYLEEKLSIDERYGLRHTL